MNRKDRELKGELLGILNWRAAINQRMAEKQEWKKEPGNRLTPAQLETELNDFAILNYPYPDIFQILTVIQRGSNAAQKRLERQCQEDQATRRKLWMALSQSNDPGMTKRWLRCTR